ncbi:MAG: hypothetical protein DRR06_01265 [Gammaproteobacteria bacterium]|nr:MAG: hypothetical protein DRR06_01265 [Gammaproteobacteria bacterium]RLA54268.1 MAG: hypothetical protein DRR42_02260 [Gammaproteobacteria bacterium]
MNDENLVFGFCWYQPEQWERLREISDDRDDLEDTYDEWRTNANSALSEFQSAGKEIKKVKINLEELLLWCNEKGVSVKGSSRAEYVSYLMKKDQMKSYNNAVNKTFFACKSRSKWKYTH